MSHFAKIEDGVVTQVIVAQDIEWCQDNLGGTWVQTSYNTYGGVHYNGGTPLRYNYAGIGFTYDEARDAFIEPQPFPSWSLNEDTCLWEAPIPYPGPEWNLDNDPSPGWIWDEDMKGWKK